MMLNEVRRKPEKPRMRWCWRSGKWACRTGADFCFADTPIEAYLGWKTTMFRRMLERQPRPIGHN